MNETKSKLPELSRQDEERKLAEVIKIAQTNLLKAQEGISRMDQDVAELYASIDHRDRESMVLWNDATIRLRQLKREMDRYEKARKKPYFGRIDFKDPTVKHNEAYYIGRVGISKTPSEPVVIDWRAPIASVYYENTLGPCEYTVSSEGNFEIDLLRKRTYSIEGDELVDFFDSDVVANDELLTSYLAKNKKAVLGEIIATIQKEQNLIIRRSPRTNMIVQGCAGSGKTTVAMHRISYILYNYEEYFRPEDFYIIGSNKILLNYITSVLPDLDVYGVSQMTMEELFVRLIYEDWDRNKYSIRPLDKQDEVNCIKGTKEWFQKLSGFCDEYERQMIPRQEVYLEKSNRLLVGKVLIDTYCRDNPGMSMQAKIHMLNQILMSKYENEVQGKNVSYTASEKKAMEKKYSTYFGKDDWKGSIFELYDDFLQRQGIAILENSFDVYDLAALAFLYKRIKELDPIREASHVVIDEAQDFGMMAYCCLHYCLRDCTYTIMGDTSQNIHFGYGLNDWEELRKLVLTGTFDAFGLLKKSYRNTVEISNFATNILRHGDFPIYPVEPIVRHGDEVKLEQCKDCNDMYARSVAQIKQWQTEGYETIAIVCRDEKETKEVWTQLSRYVDLQDGTKPEAEFGNGIMVLPVAYTKGLEFDAVLLFNPTRENYPAEDTFVKLLYVAATRALHQLLILHTDNLTKLIAEPVPKGKHQKELSAPTLTKVVEYEKKEFTQKEIIQSRIKEGNKDMKEREYIGPKRIVAGQDRINKPVEKEFNLKAYMQNAKENKPTIDRRAQTAGASGKPKAVAKQENTRINTSSFEYLSMPDNSALKPKGHSKVDFAIKWIKKNKNSVELASAAGILRIMPVSEDIIRVTFHKGQLAGIEKSYFDRPVAAGTKYKVKEARDLIEISTSRVTVRVEKKKGAVEFFDAKGNSILSENKNEPRQMEDNQNWTYFQWAKNEKFKSKGILKTDVKDVTAKARYISQGGKSVRMPLIISGKGYGIAVAGENTVLFCNIPSYGNYIFCDKSTQSDYYFILGENMDRNIELYTNLSQS